MIHIAILGFGVVGGGITEVLEQNKAALQRMVHDEIHVKYILDRLEFPDSPYGDRVVHDMSVIADDPQVSIVCETMGGVGAAFDFTMQAIRSGKSVVTSNKELVAKRGVEILAAAKEMGVSYLCEASVGGGIPQIRGMRTSLAGDTITAIDGIMNGTTNYILTRMRKDGATFEAALAEAQTLGYAEANPAADVDGLDAQRKIMILTAIATNMLADETDVYTETMTKITPADMDAAARWGGTVKLLGSSRISGEHASLYVCPVFVPGTSPLANIDDVYNGIRFVSPVTADVMYYGRGAGRLPTAGAVVSDVVAAASGLADRELPMEWKPAPAGYVRPFSENVFSYYVRVKTDAVRETLERASLIFGDIQILAGSPAGYAEFIIPPTVEAEAVRALAGDTFAGLESKIRIMAS
ncbi:MAG: homoserine dehydrogenase [Clostridiales bacterium]|jgi:homoserine dehydrogenase|nr:homoserine dehydrogenase [Clostridiales bacterium]